MPVVSARTGLQPAKAPFDQTEGRNHAWGHRRVDLRCRAPQGASGNSMIVFLGRGFSPRPISVRKHDRPMRHRKSSTASKMFLVIQFDGASNDRLKAFKFARPKHTRNLQAPKS